jgi:uncharacterized Zn finger protein
MKPTIQYQQQSFLVRCPNCGAIAERSHPDNDTSKTECYTCDYLLITCRHTGKVIEAYAPGINAIQPFTGRITVQSGFEYWREAEAYAVAANASTMYL